MHHLKISLDLFLFLSAEKNIDWPKGSFERERPWSFFYTKKATEKKSYFISKNLSSQSFSLFRDTVP